VPCAVLPDWIVYVYYVNLIAVNKYQMQSRTGCKFLTGQGVQEGATPLCRKDFFSRYCRLKPSSSGVLLKIEVGIR